MRFIAIDTLGWLPTVVVLTAGLQDRDRAKLGACGSRWQLSHRSLRR